MHLIKVCNAENQCFTILSWLDRKLPSEYMTVLVPIVNIKIICFGRSNNINDTEVVSNFNVNVFLVIERWQDETAETFDQKVNVSNFVTLVEDKLVLFKELRL